MDRNWWDVHGARARQFAGEKFAVGQIAGVGRMTAPHFGSSGSMAIAMAANRGATRIVLLGYDAQRTGGKAHWHGDHDKRLGNAGSLAKLPARMAALAQAPIMRGITVINATRETALKCWPRQTLEQCLDETPSRQVRKQA